MLKIRIFFFFSFVWISFQNTTRDSASSLLTVCPVLPVPLGSCQCLVGSSHIKHADFLPATSHSYPMLLQRQLVLSRIAFPFFTSTASFLPKSSDSSKVYLKTTASHKTSLFVPVCTGLAPSSSSVALLPALLYKEKVQEN